MREISHGLLDVLSSYLRGWSEKDTKYKISTMWVWVEIGADKLQNGSLMLNVYLLTPCSKVLLEKLTVCAANQEIPRTFGTRRFITVITIARHLSLS